MQPNPSIFNDLVWHPGYGRVPSSWSDALDKRDFARATEIGMRWLAEAPTDLSVEQRATRLVCVGEPLLTSGDPKGVEFLLGANKILSYDRAEVDLIEGVWLDVFMRLILLFYRTTEQTLEWLSVFELSWKDRDEALSSVKNPDPSLIGAHIYSRADYHTLSLSMLVTHEAFAEARDVLPKAREYVAKVPDSKKRMALESTIAEHLARLLINDGPSHYDEALKLIDHVIGQEVGTIGLIEVKAELLMKMGRRDNAVLQLLDDVFMNVRRNNHKISVQQQLPVFVEQFKPDDLRARAVGFPSVLWAFQACGEKLKSDEKRSVSQARPVRNQACVYCSKELTKLLLCSICKNAVYCGAECQKKDWKQHKVVCRKKEESSS